MTQPNNADVTAKAGALFGVTSFAELQQKISTKVDTTKPLSDASAQVVRSADWYLNTYNNTHSSPNYASDPNVVFHGGALSIDPTKGRMVLSTINNEPGRGALNINESESNFYSSLGNTTLGSLNIDTVDGYVLNPVSTIFPSTNFSPTKPWIRKLFPTFSLSSLVKVSIAELIYIGLLQLIRPNTSASKQNKEEYIDMGTILIDNSELEDKIFNTLP